MYNSRWKNLKWSEYASNMVSCVRDKILRMPFAMYPCRITLQGKGNISISYWGIFPF